MANILLVDSDKVAQRAMRGILARGDHRLVTVDSVPEAWEVIRSSVKVDLVVLELRLKGDSGLTLIQKLKNDIFLKRLPVVVYTANADKESVKRVLTLRVQNFLLKPYGDEAVFSEIGKAMVDPWYQVCFGPPIIALPEDRLRATLEALRVALERGKVSFERLANKDSEGKLVCEALEKLTSVAERVGANGIARCLERINEAASEGSWPDSEASMEPLEFASKLIFCHLNPDHCPEHFLTQEEIDCEIEARDRAFWSTAPAENRCPMVGWEQLQREIDALNGCPIVDTIAAAYQMSATGRPTSLSPLLDLVDKDPGLTAQILIEANRLKLNTEEGTSAAIEEPRMAVGLLGELRLASVSSNLISVEERMLLAPPNSSWPNFRMFQLGTAQLASFVCEYLEMPSLKMAAYTSGLIHDIGKLLLTHLHPWAFQAIHDYALHQGVKLATAERYFLEVSTQQMAAYFAEKHGLPKRFVNVLKWIDNAKEALDDVELVAIVSLARDLCRHNHVGFSGETPQDDSVSIEETPEWEVLRNRVYLNFDLKKFERQAHLECLSLKRELQGKLSKRSVA